MWSMLGKGWTAFAIGLAALNSVAGEVACRAHSPEYSVALLELYTSEGCSSCPPADHFLSNLKHSTQVPAWLVPLSLHVDYWDYIGWKDRFAQPKLAKRQREMADRGNASLVYTPQFALQGKSYRLPPDTAGFDADLLAIHRRLPGADIILSLSPAKTGVLTVTASAQVRNENDKDGAALFLVLYENNLTSYVSAGENRNARLHHDYVVRKWLGPWRASVAENQPITASVMLAPEWKAGDLGVVAFVQNTVTGDILQVLSSRLCR